MEIILEKVSVKPSSHLERVEGTLHPASRVQVDPVDDLVGTNYEDLSIWMKWVVNGVQTHLLHHHHHHLLMLLLGRHCFLIL